MFTMFHDKSEQELIAIIQSSPVSHDDELSVASAALAHLAPPKVKEAVGDKIARIFAQRDRLIAQQELAIRILRKAETKLQLSEDRRALKSVAR